MINIVFHIHGGEAFRRRWSAVPRVGDFLKLESGRGLEVTSVAWEEKGEHGEPTAIVCCGERPPDQLLAIARAALFDVKNLISQGGVIERVIIRALDDTRDGRSDVG